MMQGAGGVLSVAGNAAGWGMTGTLHASDGVAGMNAP